jgi:hypothetical protein
MVTSIRVGDVLMSGAGHKQQLGPLIPVGDLAEAARSELMNRGAAET